MTGCLFVVLLRLGRFTKIEFKTFFLQNLQFFGKFKSVLGLNCSFPVSFTFLGVTFNASNTGIAKKLIISMALCSIRRKPPFYIRQTTYNVLCYKVYPQPLKSSDVHFPKCA